MKDIQTYESYGYEVHVEGIRHDGSHTEVFYCYIGIDQEKAVEYTLERLKFNNITMTLITVIPMPNVTVRVPTMMKLVDEYSTVVTPFTIGDDDNVEGLITVEQCRQLISDEPQ